MTHPHQILFDNLKHTWSTTEFVREDITAYAKKMTVRDTRHGLMVLSGLLFLLFASDWVMFQRFGAATEATYTCALLAVLSIHILLSSRAITETQSLQMLGTTLLMISGTAFLLLANSVGTFDLVLFSSIMLLFMVVPIVPWGLREALVVLVLIYGMFTISTFSLGQGFDSKTLWSLQFIMLGSATISLAMVMRNTSVRKADIQARFDLEHANRLMKHLSHKDPLTNAWNRRYLKEKFASATADWQASGLGYHFAFADIDDFKLINDLCGHERGDLALRAISDTFEELCNDGFVVRMGGDEFALLFIAEQPAEVLQQGLLTIQAQCRSITEHIGYPINLSFGLVSVERQYKATQEEVYRRADGALGAAKARKIEGRSELNVEISVFNRAAVGSL